MDWVISRDILEIQERKDLFQLQKEDADFKDMIRYKETGELPQEESQARKILYTEDMFVIENQRLYRTRTPRNRRTTEATGIVPALCIPDCLRKELITRLHNHNFHVGSNLLTLKLQERYFWPEIWKDAKKICSKCDMHESKERYEYQERGNSFTSHNATNGMLADRPYRSFTSN